MGWRIRTSVFVMAMLIVNGASSQTKTPAHPRTAPAQAKAEPASGMTNASVIKMVTAGLADDLIITSIQRAPTHQVDLSVNGLIALK